MAIQSIGSSNFLSGKNVSHKVNFRADTPANSTTAQPTTEEKSESKKKKIVVASIALAAIGATALYGHKQGWFKKAAKEVGTEIKNGSAEGGAQRVAEGAGQTVEKTLTQKLEEINATTLDEITRLKDENRFGKGLKLDNMEKIAGDYSGDVNKENRFHFGANIVEQSYIDDFSNQELADGNNMVDKFANRIFTEKHDTLTKMYAQMPIEEAKERLNMLGKLIAEKDSHTGTTTFDKFVEDMINTHIPQAKKDLNV